MRAVVQRASQAKVTVAGSTVGEIGVGLLVLVAAHKDDTGKNAQKLAERVANLRIFNDAEGKMNLALAPLPSGEERPGVRGSVLVVSNFTVLGDASQRRPSFVAAAPFDQGKDLYEAFVEALKALVPNVQTGTYGADMKVELTNDGPVTLIVDA